MILVTSSEGGGGLGGQGHAPLGYKASFPKLFVRVRAAAEVSPFRSKRHLLSLRSLPGTDRPLSALSPRLGSLPPARPLCSDTTRKDVWSASLLGLHVCILPHSLVSSCRVCGRIVRLEPGGGVYGRAGG